MLKGGEVMEKDMVVDDLELYVEELDEDISFEYFNCVGSVGTAGSFGSVGSCGGSASTAGSFGSATG